MQALRRMQQSFMGHLLGQPSDAEGYIESTPEASAAQRLSIYASGYRLRLKEALETDYEQLHAYLGDALFDRLMDAYIDRFPSHATSLRDYSQHMDILLRETLPFSGIPVLRELERIERAFNRSFDAADAGPLDPVVLETLPAEAWPTMRPRPHASLHLLRCRYNSFPIWRALARETVPPEVSEAPSTWVIWRKDLVSLYRSLEAPEADALAVVVGGGDFSALCESLLAHYPESEVPVQAVTLLRTWIDEQMVAAID